MLRVNFIGEHYIKLAGRIIGLNIGKKVSDLRMVEESVRNFKIRAPGASTTIELEVQAHRSLHLLQGRLFSEAQNWLL